MDTLIPDPQGGYVAPILVDVVREHLDEVTFLSIQRRKLLFSPDVPLASLRRHEERIAAHRDGLAEGIPVSLELAWERIAGDDPWDVSAAVQAWLALGNPAPESVVEHLNKAGEEALPGWVEAFRRSPVERLTTLFPEGPTGAEAPRVVSLLLDAWGWHGLLPGLRIPDFSRNEDARIRRSLARVLGWFRGPAQVEDVLGRLMDDPVEEVRRVALWSDALHRPSEAAARCRAALRTGSADPFAVRVLGLLGGAEDVDSISCLLGSVEGNPAAARALGDLGIPSVVDQLIDLLDREDERLREAAADGLRTILGDLPDPQRARLPGELPPEEETVDPERLRAWWIDARRGFGNGRRCLRGRPFPWDGAPVLEPMEALWRSVLHSPERGHEWLRREVPDGFFSGVPESESRPGE
jgi:hypothetical protein